MQALEAENAKLREENSGLQERLLAAQQTLAKYAKMLFGQKWKFLRKVTRSVPGQFREDSPTYYQHNESWNNPR